MNYYQEINNIIEDYEINKKVRELKDNKETLLTNWNIGRLLVEAQGGEARARYGDSLIKTWSAKLVKKYGNGYDISNLKRFRKFYIIFPKSATVWHLSWSQLKLLLPIKDENERNYYINQVILNNLSVRELRQVIKTKSFERLSYADKNNIKLIEDTGNYPLELKDMIKDPIIIKTDKEIDKMSEKVLHKLLIEMVEDKFLELGTGFALIAHEYKLNIIGKTYRIDLLFFNVKLNSYIVVEVKTRKVEPKDISQLKFYVNYVEENIKEKNHNSTKGILIVKENDKLVIHYTIGDELEDLFILTYKAIKN